MIIVKEFVIFERLSFTLDKRLRYYGFMAFHAVGLFLYPGFLIFSRGIERDQWHEVG